MENTKTNENLKTNVDEEKQKPKKFRLNARKLYLTYPKCNLDLKLVLELLKEKLSNQIIKDYLIVKEIHKDGSYHLHAYIKLHKPINTYNCNYLDLKYDITQYHGNYQSAKNPNYIIQYLLKDFNSIVNDNLIFSDSIKNRIDLLGTWLDYPIAMLKLAREGKIEEALKIYETEKPLDFIKNHIKLTKSLNNIYYKTIGMKLKFNFKDFIIPEELKNLVKTINDGITPIIIGKSGIGKTSWLVTFLQEIMKFNPLVINNKDALRFFNNDTHNAIIFDDCSWPEDINREELIKLIDSEQPTTHSIKHSSVMINKSTPRFVIVNYANPWSHIQLSISTVYQDPAVKRRINIITLPDDAKLVREISTIATPPLSMADVV